MRRTLSTEEEARIAKMIESGKGVRTIATAVGVSRHCVETRRDALRPADEPIWSYDVGPRRIYETEEQARLFSAALNGQRYDHNVTTRTYGRVMRPEPHHVMSESMLARC